MKKHSITVAENLESHYPSMPKNDIKERQKKLLELTRTSCEDKLNDEYLLLCEKLINKMTRKKRTVERA
ncbi:MAG: hypothetical protein FH748_01065 [Balneolaceae bacterium]|nr:hypothetical protein [Balneolaceae bacterium]